LTAAWTRAHVPPAANGSPKSNQERKSSEHLAVAERAGAVAAGRAFGHGPAAAAAHGGVEAQFHAFVIG
jgi:hypothetical protein